MPTTAAAVLDVLDRCAAEFTFPMLDNGYLSLAATRLSAFRSSADWALVVEVFGFSPRARVPTLSVSAFGSRLVGRTPASSFDTPAQHAQELAAHPHDDFRAFYPLDDGWLDPEDAELVARDATRLLLRGAPVPLALGADERVKTAEFIRFLAEERREQVLATDAERRTFVAPELKQLLVLDAWHHPDLAGGEAPSGSRTFQMLAEVLETGDVKRYRPAQEPNTHWSNWPDGGTL